VPGCTLALLLCALHMSCSASCSVVCAIWLRVLRCMYWCVRLFLIAVCTTYGVPSTVHCISLLRYALRNPARPGCACCISTLLLVVCNTYTIEYHIMYCHAVVWCAIHCCAALFYFLFVFADVPDCGVLGMRTQF
jgi:hypothetical protein